MNVNNQQSKSRKAIPNSILGSLIKLVCIRPSPSRRQSSITLGSLSGKPGCVLLALSLLFSSSCGWGKIEISVEPSALRDEHLSLANIRLHGVKLGDPESKIPNDVVTERTKYEDGRPSGWLLCQDTSGFRVSNGRVVEFKLGPAILQKMNLLREDQIEFAFGKADKITPVDYGTSTIFYRRYTYIARHMLVNWSVKDERLDNLLITQ